MRKTLQDVAGYLSEIVVPETKDAYHIKCAYTNIFDEDQIREGVIALRSFLLRLYDVLYEKGNAFDNCKKVAHEYENRTGLSVYYPFLHNVNIFLINVGYKGTLSDNQEWLCCDNTVFNHKLSVTKTLECSNFLVDCGMVIEGINLNEKKQNLVDVDNLKVAYPSNPAMLIGMKIMAIAEIEHRTLLNQDVFLRCDYRILKEDETDVLSILQDTIKPLSTNVQTFILQLHQRYVEKGLACVVEVKGFHIYVRYCYKRKDVWGFNASLSNGYHINMKPIKMDEYKEVIETFSTSLQERIKKGYGCGRKRPIGHCDGGCRGIPISLDDSVLALQDEIVTWLDEEIYYLQKKK